MSKLKEKLAMEFNVSERVNALIQEVLQVSKSEILQTQDLLELGMTSLSFVRIIATLETEFEIEFDDNDFDIEKFEYVNDFTSYIQKKITV
jgi:acyl carrier protein